MSPVSNPKVGLNVGRNLFLIKVCSFSAGHETCLNPITIENCTFPVKHLPKRNMSMVIVISNVVSKGVLGVKINMYSGKFH